MLHPAKKASGDGLSIEINIACLASEKEPKYTYCSSSRPEGSSQLTSLGWFCSRSCSLTSIVESQSLFFFVPESNCRYPLCKDQIPFNLGKFSHIYCMHAAIEMKRSGLFDISGYSVWGVKAVSFSERDGIIISAGKKEYLSSLACTEEERIRVWWNGQYSTPSNCGMICQ